MKTLILFASRYGATEEIAYMLKSAVGGDVTVCNVREHGISLAEYDTVIIGSCVYMFKLDKHIKRFLRRNEKGAHGQAPRPIPVLLHHTRHGWVSGALLLAGAARARGREGHPRRQDAGMRR